jgi:hypothetical protein
MERTAIHVDVLEQLGEGEDREIARWRFESLIRVGYPRGAALVLARHVEVDLHSAADLVSRGCPPATALRILL